MYMMEIEKGKEMLKLMRFQMLLRTEKRSVTMIGLMRGTVKRMVRQRQSL